MNDIGGFTDEQHNWLFRLSKWYPGLEFHVLPMRDDADRMLGVNIVRRENYMSVTMASKDFETLSKSIGSAIEFLNDDN